ncbi:EspA/EspE family type VII secretion system effector [Mycolicibacterium sp. A43C]
MGFFDFIDDVVDTVTDAAGKVKDAAKVVEVIAKRGDLLDVVDFAKGVGKWASPLAIAPTPVLVGGQKVIQGMRWTTGDGDPITGTAFIEGATAFRNLDSTLLTARPDSDWEGSASRAYEKRVDRQQDHAAILSSADSKVGSAISREADEINETRRILDGLHNHLADFGEYTKWLGVGQVGKALQFGLESAAVGLALKEATKKLRDMQDCANNNSAEVNQTDDLYQAVITEANQQDSTGDFDPGSQDEILKVEGQTLVGLAGVQDDASREIRSAVACVKFAGDEMDKTHGVICAVTNEAVRDAETARETAGSNMAGVSAELSQKLRDSARKYDAVDLQSKENLNQQMRPK